MNDDRYFLSFCILRLNERCHGVPLYSFGTCYTAWLSFKEQERPFTLDMCIAELNNKKVVTKLYDFKESTRKFKLGAL